VPKKNDPLLFIFFLTATKNCFIPLGENQRIDMPPKLSLKDLLVKGKKVLMRVDFNVPLDKNGKITDDTRIRASLPSIQYILERGGSIILMSHLGRPKNKKTPDFSLAPCAQQLSQLLGKPVIMAKDCVGEEVRELVKDLQPGQILLLENLRFHEGEENPDKDPQFAKELASLGDLYVNDAFGTAHREHASTAVIAKYFPDKAAAGLLIEKELDFLGKALLDPKRPFYALIGGAKVSSKIGILKSLLEKADALLIGGGMAYTFFKAQGIPIGQSIHEDDFLNEAREILAAAKTINVKIILPIDQVIADKVDADASKRIIDSATGIPDGMQGVDIGPKTIELFTNELKQASTLLWNGPLGVFEIPAFATGTQAIAKVIAGLKATTIVGGGDSIAALQAAGLADKVSHVSTGGGATLEFIEYGTLPGIEALSNRN